MMVSDGRMVEDRMMIWARMMTAKKGPSMCVDVEVCKVYVCVCKID